MFGYKRKYDEAVIELRAERNAKDLADYDNKALQERLDSCAVVIANCDNADAEKSREIQWLRAELNVANANTAEAQDRLARIIASETPHMANIGRKLVDIAKGLR